MADPKQKSTLTLAQIDVALNKILDGSIASVNGINPNLLDNAYFANPVNQRGQTEYNGISTIQHSIDRWMAHRSIVTVVDGVGVNVGTGGTAVNNSGYQTSIEKPARLVGKEVTMSVLLDSNEATENIYFGVFYGAGASNQTYWGIKSAAVPAGGVGLYSVTAVLPDMGTYKAMNPVIRVQGSRSGSFTVKAAKLELGSTQTLAHQDENGNWVLNEIPDYGEQLLKCQRYYQLFSSADARPSDLADYRPNMRANPAIGTIDIGGKTYYFADANL